jgi:glycosyltransferase involved in cell wall biosynthesis
MVRVVRGLAGALAERHDVIVVHPEADRDLDLGAGCVEVVSCLPRARGPWARRLAGGAALATGHTLWAAELDLGRLRGAVDELLARYRPDVLQVEHLVLGDVLPRSATGPLRVVTVHDPAERRADVRRPWKWEHVVQSIDGVVAVRQQRRALSRADAAVVFSERDRGLVAPASPPRTEVATIPVGWEVPAVPLDPVGIDPPTLVFVGNFRHPPNVAAATRAARRVLPRVRETQSDVTLVIVGADPPREVSNLAGEHVRVTGEVDSVVPYLDRAAVVIAPIELGGGTRIKVLEAVAAGKAVVATARAAAGTGADAADALASADSDDAFAGAVVHLLNDVDARRDLAGRARAWALRELSWSTMADRYCDLYDRLEHRRHSRPH